MLSGWKGVKNSLPAIVWVFIGYFLLIDWQDCVDDRRFHRTISQNSWNNHGGIVTSLRKGLIVTATMAIAGGMLLSTIVSFCFVPPLFSPVVCDGIMATERHMPRSPRLRAAS